MAGTPPFLGFFSKQFVLYSAIESGYYFMCISGILVSIISASYYLKIIRILYTEIEFNKLSQNSSDLNNETTVLYGQCINNIHSLLISILTLFLLFFIFI